MPSHPRLLTYAEVAAILGVSPRTVKRLKNGNDLPFYTIKGQVRFHPDEVERYIASCRTSGRT